MHPTAAEAAPGERWCAGRWRVRATSSAFADRCYGGQPSRTLTERGLPTEAANVVSAWRRLERSERFKKDQSRGSQPTFAKNVRDAHWLRWATFADAHKTRPANRSRERSERLAKVGGEGGIRTHVPLTRQDAFEAPPLRPLRYLSAVRNGQLLIVPEPAGFRQGQEIASVAAEADRPTMTWRTGSHGFGLSRCHRSRARAGSAARRESTSAATSRASLSANNCSMSQQSCEPPA
jgi:hypothetical protein